MQVTVVMAADVPLKNSQELFWNNGFIQREAIVGFFLDDCQLKWNDIAILSAVP